MQCFYLFVLDMFNPLLVVSADGELTDVEHQLQFPVIERTKMAGKQPTLLILG